MARWFQEPAESGLEHVGAGKSLQAVLRGINLSPKVQSEVPEGVHLGKIVLRVVP
jgi:hypothetical protein